MAALRLSAACWLALGVGAVYPALAQDPAPEQIVLDAESATVEGARRYRVRSLTITGRELSIEADEAVTTSLEFDSRWELTGAIRMSVGSVQMTADSATFDFEAGELVAGELAGDPAVFEETAPGNAGPIRGEARRIAYDRTAGTVQMEGSASFVHGQNRMSGCDFVYELDGGLVSGSSECGVPLSIIYVPPDSAAPDSEATEAEPSAAP